VGVDEAGQQRQVAEVVSDAAGAAAHCGDFGATYSDGLVGCDLPAAIDDASRANRDRLGR
jgi:hypothetical protein